MSASYPNSVKSFTSKNTGDVIQPADVNDVQDELAAIEGGLLQGTARLNSSNSTVANLSVSGGSTFAGSVAFNGVNYQFPASAGSTGQALIITSTGSTNVLGWLAPNAGAMILKATSDAESTTTSSTPTTLKTLSSLAIAATSGMKVSWTYRKSSNASADAMFMRVQINGQIHVSATTVLSNSTAAVTGSGTFEVGPRDANNPATVFGTASGNAGGNQNIQLLTGLTTPGAGSTVTGVIDNIKLDGYNLNGLEEIRIGNVKVWELLGA